MNVFLDAGTVQLQCARVTEYYHGWYSQRPVDDSLNLVHNIVLRKQVIGVPGQ